MITRVEVIAENLLHNFSLLEKASLGKSQFPVLKSNAYGHGIKEVARILSIKKPPYFLVQNYAEAMQIQAASTVPVLVLGTPDIQDIAQNNTKGITFSISSLHLLKNLAELKKPLNIHLCLNTGMNREGINDVDIKDTIALLENNHHLKCDGVWSHFADADGLTDIHRSMQEKKFSAMLDILLQANIPCRWIHIGNSAGFLKTADPRINAFRAGMAGYGLDPVGTLPELRPTMRLISHITNIRDLQPGDSVGYSCTYTAPHSMSIGIVPVGYFEALDMRLSNTGCFSYIDPSSGIKTFLPIRGRISMNQTCFDTCNLPLKVGDEITVISSTTADKNSIKNIAHTVATIPDEMLTRVNAEIPKIVI